MLEDGKPIHARLALPGGEWRASALPQSPGTSLKMEGAEMRMTLTHDDVARLLAPAAEGIYFVGSGENAVRYLVEKDFPCIHPHAGEAGETLTETFAAPPGFEERKAEG